MSAHKGLGRGLGALFGEEPAAPAKPDAPSTDAGPETAAPVAGESAAAMASAVSTDKPLDAIFGADDGHRDSGASASGDNQSENVTEHHEEGGGNAEDAEASAARQHPGRPVMPSLTDSVHPANLFFGGDPNPKPKPRVPDYPGGALIPPASVVDTALTYETVEAAERMKAERDAAARNAATDAEASSNENGDKPQSDAADEQPVRISGAYYTEINVDDIGPNEHQPRTIFDEEDLHELSESIKEVGVLEPIVVRKRDGWEKPYELIMGERRLRATKLAGLTRIPAIVRTTADENMLRDALLENLHRVALNPLEEAAAYEQMIEDFHITHAQLAQSVSKSRSQITNTLRLLNLPATVQKKVAAGVLSAGHARALLALTDESEIEPLANKIIAEGLSVRSTEEMVALKNGAQTKQKRRKKTNPWAGSDAVKSLENRFETKVEIRGTQRKGKIEITFASPEDLDRILGIINAQNGAASHSGDGSDDAGNDGWV